MKRNVIQIIPNIGLVGGTAAKVKILAEYSEFGQIICYSYHPKNKLYIDEWSKIGNCKLEEICTTRNPIVNAYRLGKIVKKYHALIIHVYFPIGSISASLLKLFNPSVKIVRSFEGAVKYVGIKQMVQSIAFKSHDAFIAISRYVMHFYENIFSELNNKIQVVYNCPAFSEPLNKPIQHDVSRKVLVSIGGLNPSKNTETLVEIVKKLKERNINVKAYVLGDGPLRNEVEEKIIEWNIKDNLILCGFCKDVKPYLDNCSLYVHTANLEGFGMAVVEAMSRFCAVIVSDSCALPELVDNGVDGLIAKTYDVNDWADKIEYLLSYQQVVDNLGENAYQKAYSKFSANTYTSKLDSIYSKLYEIN